MEGFSVMDLNETLARTAVVTMELQRGVVGDLATMVELRDAVAGSGLLETVRSMLEAARAAEIPVVHATVSWRADRRGTPLNTPLTISTAHSPIRTATARITRFRDCIVAPLAMKKLKKQSGAAPQGCGARLTH